MDITVESDANGQNRITITYDRHTDDPAGDLTVLARSGQLGRLLREYANHDYYDRQPDNPDEHGKTLRALSEFEFAMGLRFRRLLLAGRDWHEMSWGQLADAGGTARRNVARWVQETRAHAAEYGIWFDTDGIHRDPVDHSRAQANLDAQKTRDDNE